MCKHHIQFYEEHYPAGEVSDFLAEGLEAGNVGLLVLTRPHRQAVEHCLRARGARYEEACVFVDTHEAAAQICANGSLDLHRARELLTPLLSPAARGGPQRVCFVGDLAPTLCAAGAVDDAIALEGLVHCLNQEHGGDTLCAYALPGRPERFDLRLLRRLSAEHRTIQFPSQLWTERFALPTRAGHAANA